VEVGAVEVGGLIIVDFLDIFIYKYI
jgi:hypothetical protein